MTENTMRSSRNFICSIFTRYSRGCRITAILAAAFLLGSCTGSLVTWISQNFQKTSSVPSISESTAASILSASSDSWGLSFQEKGKRPVGNASVEELKKYNAYFAQDTSEKVLYLTFDAGFENGNTPAILDALKNIMLLQPFLL